MTTLRPLKATAIDDESFRLLAIPFGGPIPKPGAPKGVDLDGEWFSDRTDIKADWFPFRLVDWHHRQDRLMGGAVLGKATLDDEPDDEGWWVTVWLKHGERRVDLIRKLREKGAQLYGSSEAVKGLVRKDDATGEILVWPYIRQALSTSPQNTYSVVRGFKATLDDLSAEGGAPTASFFDDLARVLDNLATEPVSDLAGEETAKAGRVLAARNEARLREGIADLDERGWDPVVRKRALTKFAAILDELSRYIEHPEE